MVISDQMIGDLCFFAVILFFVVADMVLPEINSPMAAHFMGL